MSINVSDIFGSDDDMDMKDYLARKRAEASEAAAPVVTRPVTPPRPVVQPQPQPQPQPRPESRPVEQAPASGPEHGGGVQETSAGEQESQEVAPAEPVSEPSREELPSDHVEHEVADLVPGDSDPGRPDGPEEEGAQAVDDRHEGVAHQEPGHDLPAPVEEVHQVSDSPATRRVLEVSGQTTRPLAVDHGDLSQVKGIPKAIIEKMRDMLAAVPEFGREKADDTSIPTIVNGYLVSQLNVVRDGFSDQVVEVAEAFSYYDPALSRMQAVVAQLDQQNQIMQRMFMNAKEQGAKVGAIETGMAYLLAERTGQLDTSNVLPETMDMTQKKVMKARQRTREQSEMIEKMEKRTQGR